MITKTFTLIAVFFSCGILAHPLTEPPIFPTCKDNHPLSEIKEIAGIQFTLENGVYCIVSNNDPNNTPSSISRIHKYSISREGLGSDSSLESWWNDYSTLISHGVVLPESFSKILSEDPVEQIHYLTLEAHGTQNYKCVAVNSTFVWELKEPIANLYLSINQGESIQIGEHGFQVAFSGPPFWRISTSDDGKSTSTVFTKKVASFDGKNPSHDIPWLLTQTTTTKSNGEENSISNIYKETKYVLRIATEGGVNPKGKSCTEGDITAGTIEESKYKAQYWFYIDKTSFSLSELKGVLD
ncbi:hypothetical protein HK096_009913, partial [Nowakowskiella sp. JEL0078]